jgi:hypothetical protein
MRCAESSPPPRSSPIASGHRTDPDAIAPSRAQRRNLPLQIVLLLHDPIGPHSRRQRIFGRARLDQRHKHVEGTTAELDRPTVGEQFAVVRQQQERPNAMPAGASETVSIGHYYSGITEIDFLSIGDLQ